MVVFMRGAKSIRSLQQGYTVIEVTIIIIVVAILAAIMVDSAVGYQIRARDSERASDVDVITRSLERYYRTQAVAVGGSYPASSITTSALGSIVDNTEAILAPGKTTNSLVIAANNSSQAPTKDQYIYQPLQVNGTLCTATPCPRYKVYYWLETTEATVTRDSLRQQ